MPGRGWATDLLGRELERSAMYDALSLALKGDHQVVVVAGDAGVGKTTLITDVARRAEDLGYTVAVGHCVDIEARSSFGPVLEALATLLAKVEDVGSRPVARRMRAFLDPATPSSLEQRDLLEDLRHAFLEAADSGPLLLVLEDLHWADTSTRDLAVALSRTARGRLLLVVSVRTDDLHRRDPARRALAEIARVTGGRRVDLGPLDRASIAGIVASVTGACPETAAVRSVLERSGGNPLYAEELAAAGPGAIPDQLSDLFLARVDALAEGPRELVRTASVDGARVDPDTLIDVAGINPAELDARLRDLLDANVLRHAGDALEFRHGLLREAVYVDLMPDERTRMHGRLAEVLQARIDADPDPGVAALSRLAFHWDAAHDLARTLAASVRAGLVAKRLGAAEVLTQLDRALSLWDRVPDAEAVAGHPRAEMLILLGESANEQGEEERGYTLVRTALDMLGSDPDRLLASRAYAALGVADVPAAMAGRQEAIRRAVEYAGDSPSEELALALIAQSWFLFMHHRFADSVEAAARAVDAARGAGCVEAELDALLVGSNSRYYLGHVGDALAGQEQVLSVARAAGTVAHAVYATGSLAMRYRIAGQVGRGLALASEGFKEGLAQGLPVQAAQCGLAALQGLVWRGRFEEAEQLLEELGELGEPGLPEARAELLLARGDADAASPLIRAFAASRPADFRGPGAFDVLAELQLAAMLDDQPGALETARSYLAQMDDTDSPLRAAAVARIGFQALCLGRSSTDAGAEELRDLSARQLASARGGLTDEWRPTYHGVQLALAEAYAASYAGKTAVPQLRAAVALAQPFGAYFALEPRLDLAQELLAHGGRDEGRELLVECWSAAHDMGARDLERRAVSLATRTRVPLPQSASREGPLSRLTPREREVLDLLATGATNKTIATTLVITEKTARAHVSSVLAKLNVENRGAAAALARSLR